MSWDLGLVGVGLLLAMSLVFGLFTQIVFRGRHLRWAWLAGSAAAFILGLAISEVWFGWATAADLQPNIDGLSFDEVLVGFAIAAAFVLAARWLTGRAGHRPGTPQGRAGHPV